MEKKHSPALSIITICRNIASEIEDTCRSVARQTFTDYEWIVIDGASTDGTREILEKYVDKMTILVSEPDSGIYNAMNKGIRLARGERLLFLNGGDCLISTITLAEVFSRKLEADVCHGSVYHLNPVDDVAVLMEARPDKQLSKLYFAYGTIFHQAAFIRRTLFEHFGLYNENLRLVSDWEKWIEFFENKCSFFKLDIVVSIFRLGGSSDILAETHDEEIKKVLAQHFTEEEMEQSRRQIMSEKYKILWSFGQWKAFNVMSIKECTGMRIYFIMHLPLLKVRLKCGKETYRLLGVIPIWTRRMKRKEPIFGKILFKMIDVAE